ncbi:MAG: hypothetical protein ACK4SY_06830 [Pyrobaculum sp.]
MARITSKEMIQRIQLVASLAEEYVTSKQIADVLNLPKSQVGYIIRNFLPGLFVKICDAERHCVYVTRHFWERAVEEFSALIGNYGRHVFKLQQLYSTVCGNGVLTRKGYYTIPSHVVTILSALAETIGAKQLDGHPRVYHIDKLPPPGEVKRLKAICKL